jgi:hypothetical protein
LGNHGIYKNKKHIIFIPLEKHRMKVKIFWVFFSYRFSTQLLNTISKASNLCSAKVSTLCSAKVLSQADSKFVDLLLQAIKKARF